MKEQKNKSKTVKVVRITLTAIASLFAVGLLAGVGAIASLYVGREDYDAKKLIDSTVVYKVFDSEGAELNVGTTMDKTVEPDKVPQTLADAFTAVEDKRFYRHNGIDFMRIAGALRANLSAGRVAQGGSTITQQLVKNTLLNSEKSLTRKWKEARIAIQLERDFSKNEILSFYLNNIYFGSGEYGVANAAQRFFAEDVNKLNAAQCAMLAGIVKSPVKYNPINHYDNSIARAKTVLKLMLNQNKITNELYNMSIDKDITIKNTPTNNTNTSTYYENVLNQLAYVDASPAVGEYKVYTYYDAAKQKTLDTRASAQSYGMGEEVLSAAMLCDNLTCGISACHANVPLDFYGFRRQPGSVIKPLLSYACALDVGAVSAADMLRDEKKVFGGDYSPSNYKDVYLGDVSVRDALINSLNVPAVELLDIIGVDTATKYMDKMGLPTVAEDQRLPLALGGMTYGCTLRELCGGYLTLARGGVYKSPSFISKLVAPNGNVIFDHTKEKDVRVFKNSTCDIITDMLKQCAREGTAKKLGVLDFEVASKTGTVANADAAFNNDAYNCSYTTDTTLCVWMGGKDTKSPISGSVTGGGVPTLAAREILSNLYAAHAPSDFVYCAETVKVKLDKYEYENGNLVKASHAAPKNAAIEELFPYDSIPHAYDDTFDILRVYARIDKSSNIEELVLAANPRLCYDVFRRRGLFGDELIANVTNIGGDVKISLPQSSLFGDNYAIVPYYLDDDGRRIDGLPLTIHSGFHFF